MGETPVSDYIQQLDDKQLRLELEKNGVSAGPITPTTRKIWKRRLAKKLGAVAEFQSNVERELKKAEDDSSHGKQKTTSILKVVEQRKASEKNDKAATTSKSADQRQFFGVFIPKNEAERENHEPLVFETKSTTLLTIKGHKNSRFKVFESYENAVEYSLKGEDTEQRNGRSIGEESEETGNKYPSLKQENLNKLMKVIENGNLVEFRDLVWSNPKYMISSADGPVVLKPNTRYNALHIAAKSNQSEICQEVLSLLENIEFLSLMFPNVDNSEMNAVRREHLLDAYLNTPEKILYETPLHFACKLGFVDVVAILTSHPQCSTAIRNKSGKTPSEVLCSRASPSMISNRAQIEQMLGEQYYVPLLRYHGNSENPIVGSPITSKCSLSEDFVIGNSVSENLKSPRVPGPLEASLHSPLVLSAMAGPMGREDAEKFRKHWLTPSKRKDIGNSVKFLRRADGEKGDEQIGRQLSTIENVGWIEYWDFLQEFTNFTTEDGLQKLEKFLGEKYQKIKPSISDEISDLAGLLENVHLTHNTTAESKSSGSRSSYETAPEYITSTSEDSSKEIIFSTPQSGNSNHKIPTNGVNSDKTLQKCDKLVKNLFEESSVEKFTEDFSQNLNICSKKSEHILANEYRTANISYSDTTMSPSVSDTSLDSVFSQPQKYFLSGDAPTKLDKDVLTAIGDTNIDGAKFPAITCWRNSILSFPVTERQRWGTPRKLQNPTFDFQVSTPSRNSHLFSPRTPSSPHDMRRLLFQPLMSPSAF